MLLKNIVNKIKIKINSLLFYYKKEVNYYNLLIIILKKINNNKFTHKIVHEYLFIFHNSYSEFFMFVIKSGRKYEKKIATFKPDLEVTKRHFHYVVNPYWLKIFIINLDLSIFFITTKIDYDFIAVTINNYYRYLYGYIFFKIENYVELWALHAETYDLSGLKTLSRFYIENIYSYNTFTFIKNLHHEFSCYSYCLDYDYLDMRILIFDFLCTPYYFLEEWFEVQLESWIILGRILLVIHYSDQKIKTTISQRIISFEEILLPKWKRSLWVQETKVLGD